MLKNHNFYEIKNVRLCNFFLLFTNFKAYSNFKFYIIKKFHLNLVNSS